MQPLISIIVPVYRVEEYLPKCVDSLIKQTYNRIEIILVDDGSPDRCGEICDEYARQDSRVVVIHKPNGGLADARNVGIEKASGDYLMFVDSDDWIELCTCEKTIKLALEHKVDIVVFNVNNIYENGKTTISKSGITGIPNKNDSIKALIYHIPKYGIYNYACNKLYSAKLFKNIRFPIGRLAEDQGTTYKLVHEASNIYVTDLPLYYYFRRTNSITKSGFSVKHMQDRMELWLERLDFLSLYYPQLVDIQIAQILSDVYVNSIKLKHTNDNKHYKEMLNKIAQKYNSNEKVFTKYSKRVWLHYHCYPLFYIFAKYIA